ncbi:sugar ABC transporter [Clostridium sp. AF18-27]|uniref:Ribose transport system substrate-binding protein n=3 Tax=Enterocloster TaxID=2719313 RepID=A0A1I0K9Q9_9FIRM|nr:substrate-binding domain-containing protein [Enterocloster lavalensis]MDR3757281.1 substrate-binding domain-containing protein [Enterocloster sp.]RHR53456.1 sugar ABC transporter [Clostridium sp. AF18-27]MCB6345103.1 substrate-binding domain-containing protein [Enterocloster lavalensis]PST28734.1 sugar ABC transporter [Enterocloster lavalensis]SEU20601.1 ribose transport system substrate-binding protein [Enterocloster lavalensis]
MKRKLIAMLSCVALAAASIAGCSSSKPAESAAAPAETTKAAEGSEAAAPSGDIKIALITMDSIDQHWVTLNEGAQKAAAELGVTVTFMSPNTKDDAQQIECVNNAVAGGYQAIVVAANGPDAISSALKEAASAGVKLVYVDSPANVDAEATFSTDNEAAGKTAGEEMIKALEAAGITSGKIGIVNVNAATDSTVKREKGFRSAFEGKGYELMETQYGEGDAAKSQTIAENYITQGVVGIFGCNEGSTTGTGNAIKASGNANIIGVGFDKSDAIMNLINDGYLLCTMAQNPDVMGEDGVKAAVAAIKGESLGGKVTDTGVSVITKDGAQAGGAPAAQAADTAEVKASQAWKIALITMDSIDQHWVTLNEGAQAEAEKLGVTVTFMSPNTKDDAQQIECVNNAVAGGYQAIVVAANGPDAISSALKEAVSAGVKLVYVDSPANVDAEATFSTDNEAAGKTAGEEMIKALEAAGITSGKIGIVNVNAATDSTVKREKGFRSAFEGKGYELMETQYGEGDAAKSQTIAENYITQGVVGIFGCNEGSTTGTGNAIKASGNANIIGVGFDKSDAIMNLINDGYLLCTMAQNPDVMGEDGVKAAVAALEGQDQGGKVTDTGVSVIKK